MDVRMPDGTVITGVPDNITQTELLARYSKFSTAAPAPAAQTPSPEPVTTDVMGAATGIGGLTQNAATPKPMAQAEIKPYEPSFFEELQNIGRRGTLQSKQTENTLAFQAGLTDPATYAEQTRELNRRMGAAAPSGMVAEGLDNLQKANETGSYAEVGSEMTKLKNIPALAALVAESGIATAEALPFSIAGGLTGGPTGAAIATGATSFAMEYGNSIGEMLQKHKVNPSDTLAVRNLLEDPKFLAEAKEYGIKRGIPVAAFDALSAGFAGRFVRTLERGIANKTIAKEAIGKEMGKAAAKEAGIQVTAGMAGEAAGQALTGENKPLDVIIEGLAEIPGGISEVATNVYRGRQEQIAPEAPTMSDAEALARSKGFLRPEQPPSTNLLQQTTPQATPVTPIKTPVNLPTSESQDLGAMLAELEAQLEGKPAPVKAEPVSEAPAPVAPVVEPVTPAAPVTQEPSITELKSEKPSPAPSTELVEQVAAPAEAERKAEEPVAQPTLTKLESEPVAKPQGPIPQQDLAIESHKYDTPDLRLKQADAFENDIMGLLYQEMESHGRAAIKNRSLTNGYAAKKDGLPDALNSGLIAFGTNDYSVFEPYAAPFPKTAKKLKDYINTQKKAAPAAAPAAPVVAEAPKPNLQVEDKDIKGTHDVVNDAGEFSNDEYGWFNPSTKTLHMQYADGTPVKHYAGDKTATGVFNLTPITNSDEAKAAVAAGKHFVTVGEDSTAIKEAAAEETSAAKGKKAAKPKTNLDKVAHLRRQSWEKNPLMAYVADKGLYHEKGKPDSLMSEFNGGKQKMISGYGPVFKSSGLQIDALLPIAIQDGFVSQDATEEDLFSLIQQAFSGKRIEALYQEQGQEDFAKKYAERMTDEEPAYEERATQSDAEWYGMSEDEYVNMMAQEVSQSEDFDALEEAVGEMGDTPSSNISERAAMELLGFTEEEIQNEERKAAAKVGEAAPAEKAKGAEPGEAAPALELETQTAEELKAKQAEVDRLTKENERLSKQAEAKAKADAERDEFVLTGSDRAADVAAARGQKDIFGAMEEEAADINEEGVKVIPFEADAAVVGDLLKETKPEDNPFDVRYNALMHSTSEVAKPKPTEFLTTEEARAKVDEWKAEAVRQGKTNKNSGRTILSLFDASGEWSKPWRDAGYDVLTFDIQTGEDINDFSAQFMMDEGLADADIWGILAAPPCTDFASSGAQYWAKKDAKGQTEASNELVRQVLRTVEFLQPKVWALENPVGRIAKLNNLPPAQLTFDPNFYGDPYTKKTLLWGNFDNNLPTAPVEPTEGSRIVKLSGKDKYARSLTPEGFAYAFFMANNAESMTPAERLARTYYGVDPEAFDGATEADEKAIKNSAFEDDYYDGNLENAANIAREVIGQKPVEPNEVASEVVGPAEKPAAPQLTREPVTIEGEFTEVGEEKQRALITDQTAKLSDAQVSSLEKFYGFARDTEEFANAVREDVINFITKGATYVNGKIRAIIKSMAEGVLSVAVAFNPQFVSMPYTIAVPQYETRTERVMQEVPATVREKMSDDAKRAYATIYPAIKSELQSNDKFFIVADKQTANIFVFNPDGTPFMQSKTLFGVGIGDFVKGDNNIVSNRITPAGLFDLGLRDAKRSVDEAHTAGEYDFGKVFVLDKSQKGANGFYSTTIMHSVWTKEKDAKQRLAALQKPGAEDSRYSFGCINVDKETYGKLVTNNLAQMDGAKIFIVPENGTNVMSFVNGEATYSTDIIRQRAEPVTKETKVEVQRAAETAAAERNVVGKEEEVLLQDIRKSRKEDRKKLFTQLGNTTRRKNAIVRRIAKGQMNLETQLELIRLEEKTDDLKHWIDMTAEKDLRPIVFLNRAGKALQDGDISEEVYEVIATMYNKYPDLLDGLSLGVQKSKNDHAAGDFNPYTRLVRLFKETSGAVDPSTIRHEVTHSLEQMMNADQRKRVVDAWQKDLTAAIKKHEKSDDHQDYFRAVLAFMAKPSIETQTQAIELLPSDDMYQYLTPSEYWAVNAEPLMARQLGGTWSKFVKFVQGLYESLKNVLGFDNKSAVHKTFKEIMGGSFERMGRSSLSAFVSNSKLELQNIKTNYKGQPMPDADWAMRESSLWDNLVQEWQDNYRDLKNVQSIITKQFGKMNQMFNAYDKEILSSGREAERLEDFTNHELRPLIKDMVEKKVTNDQLSEYMHNRYAKERNDIINEKNQSPSVRDKGSGISTEDAAKYLRELDADRKKILEGLAKKVDAIVRKSQDERVASGQDTQETIDEERRTSPHYVPLNRDESELDFVIGKSGISNMRGKATRGGFGKQALGSTKTVVNILENIMLQRGRAVHRGEAARIGKALYGMSIAFPNTDFWMPINPDATKNKDQLIEEMEAMGLDAEFAENLLAQPKTARLTKTKDEEGKEIRTVAYQVDRNYQMAKNVFPVRINGKDRFILFNPKSPEAQRLVGVLKDMDSQQLSGFVGAASTLTRWFSAVNSQYNPAFGLVNLWNDVQGGLLNLTTTPLADKKKEVFKNVLPALAGLGATIRRNRYQDTKQPSAPVTILGKEVASADWGDLWERMRLAGGKTGYRGSMVKAKLKFDLLNPDFKKKITAEDEHQMESELRALERGPLMKKAVFFADLVSDFNDTLENAVRLSAFEVAVRPESEGGMGMTDEEAAVIAKTLTINFNKHGGRTKNIRGLYAFFNAGVQNTARTAITLAGPAGKTIIKYGLMLGAFNAMIMLAFGYDDDEPPEYMKNKGFIIPLGRKDYFLFNLPGGFRAIPNAGRLITEGALISLGVLHSNKGLGGKVIDASMVLVDAVNPLGNGGGLQTLAPTFLDPYVAITTNRDAFGRPISKEDQNLNPTAGWLRTRDNATEISKGLAYFLNYITAGGEPYRKGLVSPTGDQLDYLFGQVTGGAGKEAMRAATWASNAIKGEETPAFQKPMLNRVYGELGTPQAVSARFYENITMLSEHKNIIEGRIQDGKDIEAYMKKNPESKFAFVATDIENEISGINATIHQIKQMPSTKENKDTIKRLEEGKTVMMSNFNHIVSSPKK